MRRQGLTERARALDLLLAWPQVIGPKLCNVVVPVGLRRGVLLVRAANAVWQNELTFLKQELIAKLAGAGVTYVTDLRVVVGHIPQTEPEPPPEPRTLSPEERAEIQEVAAAITDPELHTAFCRAVARHRGAEW